jgi:threonine/homoserine/homoserine lactone efflux protein
MRWEVLLSFLSAALVVQLVPGPGMLFILASGVAGGPRAGVAAALGAASGMVVHTVAAALGLAALFAHAPAAYDVLRIAGALYLFWNPKVILFYLAFLPQFVAPGAGSATVQLLVLGFLSLLLGLVIDLALGTFAGRIGDWLRTRAPVRRAIERLAGTIMGALGVRLLTSGRT